MAIGAVAVGPINIFDDDDPKEKDSLKLSKKIL